jgi:Ca2+-binding RTX toxin-like protein
VHTGKHQEVVVLNSTYNSASSRSYNGPRNIFDSEDDIIKGGEGTDVLSGGDGHDHIYGRGGYDFLFGDDDNDHLYGEDGGDWLDGGAGNDELVGGEGGDWLTGGPGYDTFQFTVPEAKYALFVKPDSWVDNPDEIMDFSTFDDQIVLLGWGITPAPSQYEEATIDQGAGYDAARTHAETLLNNDNSMLYAFVTDGVDGYLFVDVFKGDGGEYTDGLYEGVEMGIKLAGLTNVSHFDFNDIVSIY